ncbi:helicase-related protein [Salmonirosea aquatica]|uniref:ATP-dependent helicase n=1 Tax=Salmonirosea aquatica TaxID=2654236 RepID=A0A7C9FAK7_9BACT|nr:ATP-dependent helicase [Cytophagaceae bacterium SJW1-29]
MAQIQTAIDTSLIRDNRKGGTRGSVGDFLAEHIEPYADLSIVSAYFTIYAYHHLKSRLKQIDHLRFLFGEPNFILDRDKEPKIYRIEKDALSIRNKLNQKAVARECYDWIQEKVEIRSMVKPNFLHGKMYHVQNASGVRHAISGSSNFTANGLGFGNQPNIELNMVVDSDRDKRDLKAWFDELWNDDTGLVRDVKEEVMKYLKMLYRETDPEFVYLKTLYHVFQNYLEEQGKGGLLNERTGFFQSEVWGKLYLFQQDGVKGVINKLLKHGGCVLADSVGLGKTFEALAVIKYFELLNDRVLVLCPKKLSENWTVYQASQNSSLNPFQRDRFNYTVLYHTDLGRKGGVSGANGIALDSFNWGAFDLVVIDESHNFRNNTVGKYDDEGNLIKSRYQRLMDDIINAGVETRVLLLSATPVNNTLKDLRNQIYFVTGGSDTALADTTGVRNIASTITAAQKQFNDWADVRRNPDRSVAGLLERLDSGFFKLLDELTIARSRRHIEKFYDMHRIGKFPERRKPVSVYPDMDVQNRFRSYDSLNREISGYKLSLFNPSAYLMEEHRAKYVERYQNQRTANFSQETREHFLIGMMKVGFLKRLESSVQSFELSMERTIGKIEKLEQKIKNYLANPLSERELDTEELNVEDDDEEVAAIEEAYLVGGKRKFELAHLNLEAWQKDLREDKDRMLSLFHDAEVITPERDAKLQTLKGLIADKVRQPLNEGNRKVIVFTAFADTASYLYDNLYGWAKTELGIESALVTGTGGNRSTFQPKGFARQTDFNAILTNFSPRAKQRELMRGMPQTGELDLLVATDCISEGQNLQDCDYLVNYDIHWNPVRIIQRFGRIDRLGSRNAAIQLVNFWPTRDLDQYINLQNRVEARMALVDITATGEDNLLDNGQIEDLVTQDLKFRDRQLKRLQDEVLDLEDLEEGGVSLTDFSLDDFRVELARFIESRKKELELAPLGLYAVVPSPVGRHADHADYGQLKIAENELIRPGVLYCLRQREPDAQPGETKPSDNERVNPLHPYYLSYVYETGEVKFSYVSAKQVLEVFRLLCQGRTAAYDKLCDIFNQETDGGKEMGQYSELLRASTDSATKKFNQRANQSLMNGRGGILIPEKDRVSSQEDFELITWLVIK